MKVAFRDDGSTYKMGRVNNISKGGMFITTANPPQELESYVIASLDAEEFGKIIWAQGRVIRKTDSGIAVCFTRTDDKGLNMVLSFQGVPL